MLYFRFDLIIKGVPQPPAGFYFPFFSQTLNPLLITDAPTWILVIFNSMWQEYCHFTKKNYIKEKMVHNLTENARWNSKEESTMRIQLCWKKAKRNERNRILWIHDPKCFFTTDTKRVNVASGNSNCITYMSYISFLTRRFTHTTVFESESRIIRFI